MQEQVYQFNFPEYPGALMNFLNLLGETYNITLFHYRNHGAATGEHLDALGYPYQQVSDNSAYRTFLMVG